MQWALAVSQRLDKTYSLGWGILDFELDDGKVSQDANHFVNKDQEQEYLKNVQ